MSRLATFTPVGRKPMWHLIFLLAALPALAQNYASYNNQPVARMSFLRSQWNAENVFGDSSLLAYWPLTPASDKAYDASGSQLTGTFTGSTSGLGGAVNHPYFLGCPTYCGKTGSFAPYFNHSNADYVLTPSFSIPTTSFTVSAWVMANTGVGQYARIVETANTYSPGFFLGVNSPATPTQFFFIVNNSALGTCTSNISGNLSIGTDTRYFVTATYDGTNGRLYVNGSLATGSNGTCAFSAPTLPSQALRIGCGEASCSSTSGGWNGQIQGVRIYARVLSASEILAIYTAENH